MRAHHPFVRVACVGLAVAAIQSSALGMPQNLWAHFSKQTPGTAPGSRYVLPAIEADSNLGGHGGPSALNGEETNPDTVRVVLTNQFDESPWKAAAPGEVQRITEAYSVTLEYSGTATYGTDYEIYVRTAACPDGCQPTFVNGNEFVISIPGNAGLYAPERAIEVRFLTDPGANPEVLESVLLDIIDASSAGPVLAVGANDRATWLLEDTTTGPAPGSAGDECATALAINAAGTYIFDTTAQSASSPAPSCGSAAADVWFAFTAPLTGDYWFDTYSSRIGAKVEVFDTSCAGPSIACDDGSSIDILGSGVGVSCTGGVTYFVRVAENGNGAGKGLLTVKDLQIGPFIQYGHSTPATYTRTDQVSTKCVHDSSDLPPNEYNNDYFGIRCFDANRETNGEVDGLHVVPGNDVQLHFDVDPDPLASFQIFNDVHLTDPVDWIGTGMTHFTLDMAPTDLGTAFFGEFYPVATGPAIYDIKVDLVSTELLSGSGDPPGIGWNWLARWIEIN